MDATPAQIIRRRANFEFSAGKGRGWFRYKQDIEDFLNAISFVLPPGERFFIASVQNYQGRITDAVLKEQVKAFVYQEAMHSREHARCNAVLTEAFPNSGRIESFVTALLSAVRRFTPKASQLAVTCALEHFTAILSDGLLRWQETFVSVSEAGFAAMWLWHAVEETEHKAVCFDVYREVVGKGALSYLHRVIFMILTTVIFLAVMLWAVWLLRRGEKHRRAEPAPALPAAEQPAPPPRRGFFELLTVMMPVRLYFHYYKPSFHPWDDNNAHLIDEWKRRYLTLGIGPGAAMGEAGA